MLGIFGLLVLLVGWVGGVVPAGIYGIWIDRWIDI